MAPPRFRNRLLAAALERGGETLAAHLQPVELEPPQELYDAGAPVERIYFPETCIISVVAMFEDGGMTEMATVGREGMTDAAGLLGAASAVNRNIVQMRGRALALDRRVLVDVLAAEPRLKELFDRYLVAFLGQVMQTVACNSAHVAEPRCARWLLMSHDRSDGDTFPLTQEFLAQMLGVHRPTVSIIARQLQAAGLIRYSRGAITVVDRAGLEEATCECYGAILDQFERRLPYGFA